VQWLGKRCTSGWQVYNINSVSILPRLVLFWMLREFFDYRSLMKSGKSCLILRLIAVPPYCQISRIGQTPCISVVSKSRTDSEVVYTTSDAPGFRTTFQQSTQA
jgi:hypothetical protein